jgi:hypothetical protein
MSFARNFALGQQIAQTALDTYDTSRRNRRFRDIANAKPTEVGDAYTDQDAEQLRMLAGVKDAEGNPYYNLEAGTGGSYGLRSNFAYQGADGQMVQPGATATTFAPRERAMEFMGNRYAPGDLTPERIEGLRARAMADILSETDPIRGLQMRQSVKAGERDDTRFGWESQQQPLRQRQLEQSVQTGDIQLGQAQRGVDVQKAEDAAMKLPEAEVRSALTGYLNTNQSDLPIFMLGSTKDGFLMAERNPETGELGKQFNVPLSVGRKLVVGQQLAAQGFGGEALKYLSGVDDNITSIIDRYTRNALDVAKVNNDANFKSQSLKNDNVRLGLQVNSARNLQRFQDKDGNVVLVDVNNLPRGQDGVVSIPPNLRPFNARPEFSFNDITTRARALVDSGAPDPDDPKQRLTLDKALRIVRQEAESGQPYMSNADRIIAALQKGEQGGAQTPEPAAAAPRGGIMRDSQGRIQLLQPFTSFNDYRRRMVDEANRNAENTGFGLY